LLKQEGTRELHDKGLLFRIRYRKLPLQEIDLEGDQMKFTGL